MGASWKDQSRTAWRDSSDVATDERIKIGCIQRIADATEAMAKNHVALQEAHDRERRWRLEGEAREAQLRRRVAALRGVIGRMKRGRA